MNCLLDDREIFFIYIINSGSILRSPVITLPVEFDASRRAMKALADGGYLVGEELSGARSVLTAAALTYVAAAAMAILQLIRLLAIANRR